LASPLFVIAYAIAGRVDIDFETEPLATLDDGKEVFLRDIWPSRADIQEVESKYVIPRMFEQASCVLDFYRKDESPDTTDDSESGLPGTLADVNRTMETYAKITTGNPNWNKLSAPTSTLYPWDASSTYIRHPPFFKVILIQISFYICLPLFRI